MPPCMLVADTCAQLCASFDVMLCHCNYEATLSASSTVRRPMTTDQVTREALDRHWPAFRTTFFAMLPRKPASGCSRLLGALAA